MHHEIITKSCLRSRFFSDKFKIDIISFIGKLTKSRVEISQNLLNFLNEIGSKSYTDIITDDEIWMYFENPRTSMCLDLGKPFPTYAKKTQWSKK